jgi:hypothetical protein
MEWFRQDADIFDGEKEDSRWLADIVWGTTAPPRILRETASLTSPAGVTVVLTRAAGTDCPG